jgi:hypothetical protein
MSSVTPGAKEAPERRQYRRLLHHSFQPSSVSQAVDFGLGFGVELASSGWSDGKSRESVKTLMLVLMFCSMDLAIPNTS